MSTPDSAEAEVIVLRPSAGMASVQGALALDLTPRTAPPRPRLRSTRASDLADLERASREQVDAFVGRYLQAAVEIAAGGLRAGRPVPAPHGPRGLRRTVGPRPDGHRRRRPGAGPGPGTQPGAAGRGRRTHRPDPQRRGRGRAHVRYGRRSRAVAARFEVVRDRWQCVAITWG